MLLLNLGFFSLIVLLLLLPQAQSTSRSGIFAPHPRHHAHRSHHAPSTHISTPLKHSMSQIQMVTRSNENQVQNAELDIAMVTAAAHHQAQELGGMLHTRVAGDNSQSLPLSGLNQEDDATTIASMLDTSSGPNPGGNSEVLNVSAIAKSFTNRFDTPVSGPNPGGNSQLLNVSAIAESFTNMLDTPVSGPNPGGNSQLLNVSAIAKIFTNMLDTPVSGPNPGGNSQLLNVSAMAKSFANMMDVPATAKSEKEQTWHAEGTLANQLPRAPVPPSGPSPTHNTMVTSQGLFAERKLRGVVGCEQHLEAYTNTINSMGAAILTTS